MSGGEGNGNAMFAVFVEENRIQYDTNSLPQLQLFRHSPIEFGDNTTNCIGNEEAPIGNRPNKRVKEGEPVCRQPKVQLSLNNNFCPDDIGRIGTLLNPNPVSTGVGCSSEKEEHTSSVTSAGENMKNALLGAPSLSNSVEMEIDRWTKEFDQYIKLQEENIRKGVLELSRRHTVSVLNALEKQVNRKLYEKELEIENMNQKNKELGERINQVAKDAQTWHYRAKYNESIANVLKSNIQQLLAHGTSRAWEGSGESELDDAVSCTNHLELVSGSGNQVPTNHRLKCRGCKGKEASVLLFPCRHLCLCIDCEGFIEICPICQVVKTASVQVYMS
ncbi:SBP (S-ribonuclease binding protein) family protein [Forsythia ovata]|uniref:SBP (S-ribonuclease binding protein) family protein n=1 Tax=Forsythia ovata TaxID=205694 RepID=A0ABD1TSI9_9LAMI